MSKIREVFGLWKFFSLENWITLGLVVVIVAWSLLDIFLPADSVVPDFSIQVALTVTVVAIAASLIFLQARLRRVESAISTKDELSRVSRRISQLEAGVATYAQRAEDFARRGAPNQIDGPLIAQELDALLQHPETAIWKFRGGSGRWQRDVVLPTLAKVRDRDVVYKMLLLDPREDRLCSLYARYRNTHRQGGAVETVASIRLQIAACIVAAIWASLMSRVKPEIRLGSVYSPLRLDLGASGAMMTVSDLKQPGLLAASDSWFYRALDDELERLAERAPQVIIDHGQLELYGPESSLDEATARAILTAAAVKQPGSHVTEPLFTEAQMSDLDLSSLAQISWPSSKSDPLET